MIIKEKDNLFWVISYSNDGREIPIKKYKSKISAINYINKNYYYQF